MEQSNAPRPLIWELDQDDKSIFQLPDYGRYWAVKYPLDCQVLDENGLKDLVLSVFEALFESLYED